MRFPRRATAPVNQPFTYECGACGATQHSLDRHIPLRWSILKTSILCDDCTASAVQRARRTPARKGAVA